eukprot:TRINITY_DN44881_c1_g1_i1.p1 TRINITY_DN44881_c1_g1~~TRINITY_DN44881_c1_g1_i1.p1  ORF type:complete len:122 (+),score=1.15 TRINITY_DN44881_c1_g1_i1:134-499(+)
MDYYTFLLMVDQRYDGDHLDAIMVDIGELSRADRGGPLHYCIHPLSGGVPSTGQNQALQVMARPTGTSPLGKPVKPRLASHNGDWTSQLTTNLVTDLDLQPQIFLIYSLSVFIFTTSLGIL